jgi:hypothetical protein
VPTIHADFDAVLDAVEIQSLLAYTVRGVPRLLHDAPVPADGSPVLPAALESDLYAHLYTRPTSSQGTADLLAQRDFVAALSAANCGHGAWEPHWLIGEVDEDGRIAVTKDGLTFWVPPTRLRPRGERAIPGEFCRVHIAKEIRGLMPGFYLAIGDSDEDDRRDDVEPPLRLYWHLTAGAAAGYMAAVTTHLNSAAVPFRTKVLNDPAAYRRADAGVVYFSRRHFDKVHDAVGAIFEAIHGGLRPEVPLFTKRLAPGLGLAEDPGNGLSFGQHRCRLVARALWSAFERRESGRHARAAVIADTFADAGLQPICPYLEPGSTDIYSIGFLQPKTTPNTAVQEGQLP